MFNRIFTTAVRINNEILLFRSSRIYARAAWSNRATSSCWVGLVYQVITLLVFYVSQCLCLKRFAETRVVFTARNRRQGFQMMYQALASVRMMNAILM